MRYLTSSYMVLVVALLAVSCGEEPVSGDDLPTVQERDEEIDANPMVDRDPEPDAPTPAPINNDDPVVVEDPVDEPPVDEPPPACNRSEGCIDSFPAQIVDTTAGGTREFDTYACDPLVDESGPERLYRLDVPYAGFLAAEVLDEGFDVDVDVHLLLVADTESCMDRGHYTAGAYVEPGTYWLAVDTWVDENGVEYSGDFEVGVNVVRPEDLAQQGMKADMSADAMTAFRNAWQRRDTKRFEYTITDFSLHSRTKRKWVMDLVTGELLFHLHTGHGEASVVGNDTGIASVFSNIPQSHQSSLGMILTAETYTGDYGYSLRLDGLEAGFNDNVRDRFIVVHPWTGSAQEYVDAYGEVAVTWGCPAITPAESQAVIDTISGGSAMFFWYPDANYLNNSTYLQ